MAQAISPSAEYVDPQYVGSCACPFRPSNPCHSFAEAAAIVPWLLTHRHASHSDSKYTAGSSRSHVHIRSPTSGSREAILAVSKQIHSPQPVFAQSIGLLCGFILRSNSSVLGRAWPVHGSVFVNLPQALGPDRPHDEAAHGLEEERAACGLLGSTQNGWRWNGVHREMAGGQKVGSPKTWAGSLVHGHKDVLFPAVQFLVVFFLSAQSGNSRGSLLVQALQPGAAQESEQSRQGVRVRIPAFGKALRLALQAPRGHVHHSLGSSRDT